MGDECCLQIREALVAFVVRGSRASDDSRAGVSEVRRAVDHKGSGRSGGLWIRLWGSSPQQHDLCVTCYRWELLSGRGIRGDDQEPNDDPKRPEELNSTTHTVCPGLPIRPAYDESLLPLDA
jgi:hypothetical protein